MSLTHRHTHTHTDTHRHRHTQTNTLASFLHTGEYAKAIHCSRVLCGPWGSAAFRADLQQSIEQLRSALGPDHPWIVADLPQIAKEAGLADGWSNAEAFACFIRIGGLVIAPSDVLLLVVAC